MKTLTALLILLFASTAFAETRPIPTFEYCQPIRDFVHIDHPAKELVNAIRLALLKDYDLLCFNEKFQNNARDKYSVELANECIMDETADYCLEEDYYRRPQRNLLSPKEDNQK